MLRSNSRRPALTIALLFAMPIGAFAQAANDMHLANLQNLLLTVEPSDRGLLWQLRHRGKEPDWPRDEFARRVGKLLPDQMLLDEAKRDVQIGSHEALVDINRSSSLGCAQRAMPCKIARIMTDDAIFSRDVGANDEVDLFCGCSAMQASSNKNRDAFDGNSGGVQASQ